MDEYVRTRPVKDPGYRDLSYFDQELLEDFSRLPMTPRPYHDFKRYLAGQELVLVVGGETHGVSGCARKFAHEHLGERVHVPLENDIDSLNVVSAASVILFEVNKTVKQADIIKKEL